MTDAPPIPAYGLYGEGRNFPDVCHVERITDRAAGHDWRISPHRHEDLHQVLLIRRGVTVFHAEGQTVTLPAPVAINVPRRIVHGFAFDSDTDGHVFTIPVSETGGLLDEGLMSRALARPASCMPDDDLIAVIDRLEAVHGGNGAARVARLRGLAAELLGQMAEALLRQLPAPESEKTHPLAARFDAYVTARIADPLTVAQIASALAASPTHLNRIIRTATGLPVLKAVESLRMREACRLLAYTRRPVANVGAEVGYPDPAYFSRAFQKHTGLAPRTYRQRLGG